MYYMNDTAVVISPDVRPETATFALQVVQTADGTDAAGEPKFKTEFNVITKGKSLDEIKAKAPDSILIEQTFGYMKPTSPAGFAVAIPDPDEQVIIFNAGLAQRFRSKASQALSALDADGNPEFQPVEGTYDMQAILNEPLQRRNLTPTEKLERALVAAGLPTDMISSFLQQAAAQQKGN
jgi:hypothetical protein